MVQCTLITVIFLAWFPLQLCHSGVCVCACLHFPYSPTPPLTAHPLCRYSDSTDAPLVRLLSPSWTSSLIEPKWNNWSPNLLPVTHSRCSQQLLSLLCWRSHFCRSTFSQILWASSQTGLYPFSSYIIKALMVPIISLVAFQPLSWLCKGDLIEAESLSRSVLCAGMPAAS